MKRIKKCECGSPDIYKEVKTNVLFNGRLLRKAKIGICKICYIDLLHINYK